MSSERPGPTPFALAIRAAREATSLSLTDLARESGVSKGYLSMLEHGWKKHARPVHWAPVTPSVRVLDDLVAVLDAMGAPARLTDEMYRILSLDPPVRDTEDANSETIRGLHTAGIPLRDLTPKLREAILRHYEQEAEKIRRFPDDRRGRSGGPAGSGRAEDRAATG